MGNWLHQPEEEKIDEGIGKWERRVRGADLGYNRHFARNCPTRKKGRQFASTIDVDPKPPQRDEDIKDEAFFFISALSGTVPTDNDIWLIDSGASRHMIGYRDHLTDLVEKESSLHVVLGDNARYNVKGVGTSTF